METILISTGLACIIIAIVGGGLEAFNIKVPSIISSVSRQILLAVFGFIILAFGIYRGLPSTSDEKLSNLHRNDSNEAEIDSHKTNDQAALTFYQDFDHDGFGNKLVTITTSTQPTSYVTDSTDDDDNDPNTYDIITATIFYADVDQDGFGDKNKYKKANKVPADYVTNSLDCDDRSYETNPNQTGWFEIKSGNNSFDYNCDGLVKKENEKMYLETNVTDNTVHPPRRYKKYTEGWERFIPDCGETAVYIIIQNGLPRKTNRTQRCN